MTQRSRLSTLLIDVPVGRAADAATFWSAALGVPARLVSLGAVELRRWLDCRILRAPGGHLLCVIPLHSDPDAFRQLAHEWATATETATDGVSAQDG